MRLIRLLFSVVFLQVFSLSVFCTNQGNLKIKQNNENSIEIQSVVWVDKIREIGSNLFEYGFGSSLFDLTYVQVSFLILPVLFGFSVHFTPARRFLQILKDQGSFSEGIVGPIIRGSCLFLGSSLSLSTLMVGTYFLLQSDFRYKSDFLYNFVLPMSLILLVGISRSCMSSHSLFNIDETKRGVFAINLRMFMKGALFSALMFTSFAPLVVHFEEFIYVPSFYSLLISLAFSFGLFIPFVMVSIFNSTASIFAIFSPIVKFISSVIGWIVLVYVMLTYRFFALDFCDCYALWNLIFVLLLECAILELIARWKNYTKIKILLSLVFIVLVLSFLFGSHLQFMLVNSFSSLFDYNNISNIALK